MAKHYNWKRFWCPPTGRLDLSDGGYLSNPETPPVLGDSVSFDEIADVPCLILLGEPGMGKSTVIDEEVEKIKKTDEAFLLNLGRYSSEDRLIRDLTESDVTKNWKNGTTRLSIFLDSLDECLLRIDTVAGIIGDEIKKFPVDRLRLRIACRTFEWPNGLEKKLKLIFGSEQVKTYELAPLTKSAVLAAAQENGVNPAAFLKDVAEHQVQPLAFKPLTLNFLLKDFAINGRLSSNQNEIYLQGCRALCEEANDDRRDANLIGELTVDQRLQVAMRIAAVTLLANRSSVWKGLEGDCPDEDISVAELVGGEEIVGSDSFPVQLKSIHEVLSSGLFSSRGQNRHGWAHHTYAEFLTAYYLVQRELGQNQIVDLLMQPGLEGKHFIPQLHGLVAYLASLSGELRELVVEHEPELILRSDLTVLKDEQKAQIVEALLIRYENEQLLDRLLSLELNGKKLSHPHIAEQLRPYSSKDKKLTVRQAVIDIAIATETRDLIKDFIPLVLDETEPMEIRKMAGRAIYKLGDKHEKKTLRKFLTQENDLDPFDELRGLAFRSLWPNDLTPEELFAALTSPNEGYFGSYCLFIRQLSQNFPSNCVLVGLNWINTNTDTGGIFFRDLETSIAKAAWNTIEKEGVADGLIDLMLKRARIHGSMEEEFTKWTKGVENNQPEKRRFLLVHAVKKVAPADNHRNLLVYVAAPLMEKEDLDWMLRQLAETEISSERKVWAELIVQEFDPYKSDELDKVLIVATQYPELHSLTEWVRAPVVFGSSDAERMQQEYGWKLKRETRSQDNPIKFRSRLIKLLDLIEGGQYQNWTAISQLLAVDPITHHSSHEFCPDLVQLPGWKASEDLKPRLISGAEAFLRNVQPNPQGWIGKNLIDWADFAGYRAIRFLFTEVNEQVLKLDNSMWSRWAPVIIAIAKDDNDRTGIQENLLEEVCRRNPDVFVQTVLQVIDHENSSSQSLAILYEMDKCVSVLTPPLIKKLSDTDLTPVSFEGILLFLIRNEVDEAKNFIYSLFENPNLADGNHQKKLLLASKVLFSNIDDAGWEHVWKLITSDSSFGEQLVQQISHWSSSEKNGLPRLSEKHLYDFYLWMAAIYPPSEDPRINGAHAVSQRESIGHFRDSIIQILKNKGTEQSCIQLRRIVNQFPQYIGLRWQLLEAERKYHVDSWRPAAPSEILNIFITKSHLILSADHLLQIIVESLRRFQNKLIGETPIAFSLWDEVSNGIFRPKEEAALSDLLKNHLDEDLVKKKVIVNREVQIRRKQGGVPGQNTDIHVDVFFSVNNQLPRKLSLIIEVKGCWNQGLFSDMKAQLAERYLEDNLCTHGLYVTGWYFCPQWDETDSRRKKNQLTSKEFEDRLVQQATELSVNQKKLASVVLNCALK